MKRVFFGFVSLTLFVSISSADTLTLRNNAEINGSISYHDGTFTITARYGSETKTAKFDRADVRAIEINARYFNPGEPPKDLSIFVYHSTSTKDASTKAGSSGNKKDVSKRPTGDGKPVDIRHSVLGTDDFNPSTDDVLWLRNKNKLTGHLVSIENGQLTFKQGKAGKQFQVGQVATILIAPNQG
jgi:hypothetical protein